MKPARPSWGGRNALLWAILLPLFYLPVLLVLGRVVATDTGRAALCAFAGSSLIWRVLGFTAWESLLSAAGSVLIALPGAYLLGRHRFRGKELVRSLLVLPFVLPSVLAVLAMVVTFGRNGLLNQVLLLVLGRSAPRFTGLYGLTGIVLTHVFFNFALGVRVIGEAWERLDPTVLEAAHSLGANRVQTWWSIVLPLIRPSVAASFILAFIYSSLSFTVVLVFGGIRYRTFEVLLYTRLNQDLDFIGAYAVAAVQMVYTAVLLILRTRIARWRQRVSMTFAAAKPLPLPRGWLRVSYGAYLFVLVLFFLGPLGNLLQRAWRARGAPDGAWTGANFASLFAAGFRTGVGKGFATVLATSLGLALAVGLTVTVLAYILVLLRGSAPVGVGDAAVELPLGASLVTLSLGLLALYGRFLPAPVLVLWAQVLLGLPLGYMVLRQARTELGRAATEAARSLGASWWRAKLDIEIPLLRRPLMTVFAYGAAFSLGDVAGVLMLGQGRLITLPVALYRLMGHYRFPQALALGSLLLFLSLGVFFLIDRTRLERWAGGYDLART